MPKVRKFNRYTKEDDKYLVGNYDTLSIKELSITLGRSKQSIIDRATKQLGLNKIGHDLWTTGEKKLLIRLYGVLPISELVNEFEGHTKGSIKKKAFDLRLKYTQEQKFRDKCRYSCNDSFFSEVTLLNSYWAGFIAADGNISSKNQRVTIGLSRKDKNHLLQFKKDSGFDGPVCDFEFICGFTDKKGYGSSLSVYCTKQWKSDLNNNFNITPRKTFTLSHPSFLSDLNSLSYLVGYIDGDGCIWGNESRLTIEVLGTKKVLLFSKKVLSKVIGQDIPNKIEPKENIFRFRISGIKSKKIIEQVKALNIPFLQRKWNI